MTHSPEIKSKIIEMKAAGATLRDIAKSLGVGKSTVSSILRTGQAPKAPKSQNPEPAVSEEDNMPRLVISELPEQDNYLKAVEPQAPAPDTSNKAAILEFARNMRRRKEVREEPPQEEVQEEAPEEAPAPKPKAKLPDKPLDKGTLIAKISSLVSTFAPILVNHVKDPARFIESLPSKSQSDLKTTLDLLEGTKNIAMGGRALFNLFGMVAGGVEKLVGTTGILRGEGYQAALLSQEEELRLIFHELAFENVDSIKKVQSPTARLCFLMVTTLFATDSRNKHGVPANEPTSAPAAVPVASPDVQESKFSDL